MKSKPYVVFLLLIVTVSIMTSCRGSSATSDTVWPIYENQDLGYSFSYPSECTYGSLPVDCKNAPPEDQRSECLCFLNPNPERVVLQAFQNEDGQLVLAEFSVAHLTTPEDNPPSETGLPDWLAENFPDQWEDVETEQIKLDGKFAVSIFSPQSAIAPAIQEIYFIHTDQLLKISMLNPDMEVNNKLYERILSSFLFREVIRPLVIQPEENQGICSDFWTVYEDQQNDVCLAVPCFWEVNFPPPYHPSGTAYPIRNYSEAFSMFLGKNHNALWENDGIKIEMNFDAGENWGLSVEATLEDYLSVDKTSPESELKILSSEAILINGQNSLRVTTEDRFGMSTYYLIKVSESLFLRFGVYPPHEIDNPECRASCTRWLFLQML